MNVRIKDGSLVECVGAVTVVMADRIIFQGQIKNDHVGDRKSNQNDKKFIVLELKCEPAIIRDNAEVKTICPPLYVEGDIVKLNVAQIISIGPSNGCIGKFEYEDHEKYEEHKEYEDDEEYER